MLQALTQRDRLPRFGKVGQVPSEGVVQVQIALGLEHQAESRGELLGHASNLENGVPGGGDPMLQVGVSDGVREDEPPMSSDGDLHAGSVVLSGERDHRFPHLGGDAALDRGRGWGRKDQDVGQNPTGVDRENPRRRMSNRSPRGGGGIADARRL